MSASHTMLVCNLLPIQYKKGIIHPVHSYRKILSDEFEIRIRRNSAYSLRSYARNLGLSHSSLSRILAGTQGLSQDKALLVAKSLRLNATESSNFEALVQSECARSEKVRAFAKEKIKENEKVVTSLSLEYFKVVSDWYHFAIIELTAVEGFKRDPLWISRRLGITPTEAKDAVTRLLRLELIEKNPAGQLIKTEEFRAVTSAVPNRSVQSHHQQILKKAETALFEQPIEERDFSSTSFAMSSQTLAWAKDEMKKFRRSLTKRLAQDEKKDRLYALSMQLFALDKDTL
jgi:uncharacterized protein (TIGR02147 family)